MEEPFGVLRVATHVVRSLEVCDTGRCVLFFFWFWVFGLDSIRRQKGLIRYGLDPSSIRM
jgi:hypothetical protein